MQGGWWWRKVVATGVAGLSVLVSCSRGADKAGPTAEVPTTAPTTTTADPYAVPEVIDVAYVNRVLAALDAAVGDVARVVVLTRAIPPGLDSQLRSLYVEELTELRLASLQKDLDANLSAYRHDPGNRETRVTELINADPICIFARVTRDYSRVSSTSNSEQVTEWVELVRSDEGVKPANNLTGWKFRYDGFERERSEPGQRCTDS